MEKRKILRAFSIVEALIVVTVLAIAIVASTPLITRKIAAIKDTGSTLGGSNHGRFEVFYKEISCFSSSGTDNCYEKKGPAASITVYERLDDTTAKTVYNSFDSSYLNSLNQKSTLYREWNAKPITNRDGSITKAKIRIGSATTTITKGGKYIFEPDITYNCGTYTSEPTFTAGLNCASGSTITPSDNDKRVIEGFITRYVGQDSTTGNDNNLWYLNINGTGANYPAPKVHPIPWETVYSGKKVIIDKPIPGVVVDGETRYIADFDAPEKASNIVFHAVGAGAAGGGLGDKGKNIYTLIGAGGSDGMSQTDLTYIKNILKDRVTKLCTIKGVTCPSEPVISGNSRSEREFRTRGSGFTYSYDNSGYTKPWVFLNTETGNIVVKFDTRYDMIKPEELLDYTKELGASTQNSLVYDGPSWFDWTNFNRFCVGGWTAGGNGGKGSDFVLTTYNKQYTKDNFGGATSNPSAYGGDYANNDATGYYDSWVGNKTFQVNKKDKVSEAPCSKTNKYNWIYTCKYSEDDTNEPFYVRHEYISGCEHSYDGKTADGYCKSKQISGFSDVNVARTKLTCTRTYKAGAGGAPGNPALVAVPIEGQVSENITNYVARIANGNDAEDVSATEGYQLDEGGKKLVSSYCGSGDPGYNTTSELTVAQGGHGSSSYLSVSSGGNSASVWSTGGRGSYPCAYCNYVKYGLNSDVINKGCTIENDTSTCSDIVGEIAHEHNNINSKYVNKSSEVGFTSSGIDNGAASYYTAYNKVDSDYSFALKSCSTEEYNELYNQTLMKYFDITEVKGCAFVDSPWIKRATACGSSFSCSQGANGDSSGNKISNCTSLVSSTSSYSTDNSLPKGINSWEVEQELDDGNTTGLYNFVYHWIIPFSMNYLAYGEGGGAGEYATAKMSGTKSGAETKSIRIELGKPGVWDSSEAAVINKIGWDTNANTQGADGGDTTIDLVSTDSTTKRILTAKGGKGGKGGKFTHRYDVGFAHNLNTCSTPAYSNGVTSTGISSATIPSSIDCLRGTELAKTTKNILAAAIEYSAMETIKSLSQSSSIIGIGLGKGAEGAGTTSNLEEYSGYRKLLNSSSSFGTEDSANTQLVNDGSTLSATPNNNKANFTNQLLKPSELNFQGGGGAVIIVW